MRLAVSVTVTQIGEDGSTRAVGGELAAALAGPVEQFTGMLTWTAEQAGAADHGDREKVMAESGLELQRRLLESTFTIDADCEERVAAVTSAAGIRHGTVEAGHDRGVVSIFGPVRAQRLAYRNRREANLYPADALGSVGPRRLALVPMIAGRSALFSFERPDVCYIGYPLPQPGPGAPATADSALATILGPVRASILQALRQPLTVNELAAAVHCAPTTATYHLHQLAAAGLITRQKSGPSVWISRTARGDELVDLLSD